MKAIMGFFRAWGQKNTLECLQELQQHGRPSQEHRRRLKGKTKEFLFETISRCCDIRFRI